MAVCYRGLDGVIARYLYVLTLHIVLWATPRRIWKFAGSCNTGSLPIRRWTCCWAYDGKPAVRTGSAFLSVAAGTVADLFVPSEIQNPMTVYTVAAFIGPAVGPVIGGFINSFASCIWTFLVAAYPAYAASALAANTFARSHSEPFSNPASVQKARRPMGYILACIYNPSHDATSDDPMAEGR
ncbi:putative drug/proton antiporter YHK8 [Glarea lozoyensis 74030]|uniref:Putative drug/proton antiporter YHK8 n=1 Tax=Glarea lozoyensis (strain ATCC 74030 / MF5533) TaxID=1104152 RepID=H0EK90_GLAL7|nr:putative drug/proton antiporter YHK8 [Glarea lozoyensis 74030]